MRYKFDYSDFSPFKEKDLEAFENYEDFYRYCSSHTYLSGFAENSTHLFLKTSSEDGKDFVSFTTNEVKNDQLVLHLLRYGFCLRIYE